MRGIQCGPALVLLASCACGGGKPPAHGVEAPRPPSLVGVRTLELVNPGGSKLPVMVWYPASGGAPQRLSANAVKEGYDGVPDGPIAPAAPAPLVILLHGSGGGAEGMAWIAVDLVAHGAIAVAADHPASAYGDGGRRSILDVWEQPDDVRAMIDQLEASEWASHIDPDRIAVIGFSLGGGSAMLLAGARLDFARVPEFCKAHQDGACEGFAPHLASLDAAFFAHANADHADHRIRAAVAIAPGFSEAMTAESLHALAPTLVIAAEHDQELPPETHLAPILGELRPPSTYHEIAGAQHFSFLILCRPNAGELLAPTHEEFLCAEPYGRSRAQIHAEALDAIDGFLREQGVLPGS